MSESEREMDDPNGVVAAVVQRFYDAINSRDGDAVGELIGDAGDVLFVGTDGDEWWSGSATVVGGLREQLRSLPPGMEITAHEPVATIVGDVAWFADRPSFRLPDGSRMRPRLTGVAVRRGERWRLVQGHISIGGT